MKQIYYRPQPRRRESVAESEQAARETQWVKAALESGSAAMAASAEIVSGITAAIDETLATNEAAA